MADLGVQRPEWEIDRRLKRLTGENVRVRVEAFAWRGWGREPGRMIRASDLVLPNNMQVHSERLYFEGRLAGYSRRVSVVFVVLDFLELDGKPARGRVIYRGRGAFVLQGPAVVELHFQHFVESVPEQSPFYWEHLTRVDRQWELPLGA
jgi:hypothetical protein